MASHVNRSPPRPLTDRDAVARGADATAGSGTSAGADTTDSTTESAAAEDTTAGVADTSIAGDAERAGDGKDVAGEGAPATASGVESPPPADGAEVDGDWLFTPARTDVRGATDPAPRRGADAEAPPVLPEPDASESEGSVRPGRRVGAPARVDELVEAEPSDGEPDPAEPPEPVVSAKAIGIAARPEPTPRATASAPTRPTYKA